MDNYKKIITELVELHSDYLYKWALYKTSSIEISEDLVQETFLIAFKSLDKFENKSSYKTWLISILNNLIYEHYRKKAKHKHIIDIDVSDFFSKNGHWQESEMPKEDFENNILDDKDFQDIFENCLGLLPEKWKAIIVLKYLKDIPTKDICKDLEITQTNYWQLIHRATLHLRKCLESNYNK